MSFGSATAGRRGAVVGNTLIINPKTVGPAAVAGATLATVRGRSRLPPSIQLHQPPSAAAAAARAAVAAAGAATVTLDYDMGLVRVSTPQVGGNSAAGSAATSPPNQQQQQLQPGFHFNQRRNNFGSTGSKSITVISSAPTSPTKVIRSTGSLSAALRASAAAGTVTSVTTSSHQPGESVLKPIPKSSIFTIAAAARKANKNNIKIGKPHQPVSDHGGYTKPPLQQQQQLPSGGGGDSSGGPGSNPTKLRELLMAQLDLIQRQSQAIVNKDRQLNELRKENRTLLQKLTKFNEDVQLGQPPSRKRLKVDTKDQSVETTDDLLKAFKVESSGGGGLKIRRRKQNSCSGGKTTADAANEPLEEDEEVEEKEEVQAVLETDEAYFTFQGEEFCASERRNIKEILQQSECPMWRTCGPAVTSPAQQADGTENLDDDVILKRHDKPEMQEKRRKRWDMQRLREQRQVEKLKARYDPGGVGISGAGGDHSSGVSPAVSKAAPGSSKAEGCSKAAGSGGLNQLDSSQTAWLGTFFPEPELATHIFVGDNLPVSAFGYPLPDLLPPPDGDITNPGSGGTSKELTSTPTHSSSRETFRLPWSNATSLKSSSSTKRGSSVLKSRSSLTAGKKTPKSEQQTNKRLSSSDKSSAKSKSKA